MKRQLGTKSAMTGIGKVVDNFAGGGGASLGIRQAIGRDVDIAVNHCAVAIAMHSANHPGAVHFQESVFDVDPVAATGGDSVTLGWFSPACPHFSRARSGKPRERKERALAWVALKWAAQTDMRMASIENVSEMLTWGPLDRKGRIIKKRKGETFRAFIDALSTGLDPGHPACAEIRETLGDAFPMERLHKGLGFKVEWRELRACDFGAPTIRRRLFLFMRRDGLPIVWPQPTHHDPSSPEVVSGRFPAWRSAAECIDWAVAARSVFGRDRPLSQNTMRRIAKGVKRFVLEEVRPFLVPDTLNTGHGEGSSRVVSLVPRARRSGGAPLTVHAAHILQQNGGYYDGPGRSADSPFSTITVKGCQQQLVVTTLRRADRPPRHADSPSRAAVRAFAKQYLELPDLVTVINGVRYQVCDIAVRMFKPHELFAAQGFDKDYVISLEHNGRPLSLAAQTRLAGNAVCPPVARALVMANLDAYHELRGPDRRAA